MIDTKLKNSLDAIVLRIELLPMSLLHNRVRRVPL